MIPKSIWSAANKTQMFGSSSSRRDGNHLFSFCAIYRRVKAK